MAAEHRKFKDTTDHNLFLSLSDESNTDDGGLPWRISTAQTVNDTPNKSPYGVVMHSKPEQEAQLYAPHDKNTHAEDSQQRFNVDSEDCNALKCFDSEDNVAVERCDSIPGPIHKNKCDKEKFDTLATSKIYAGRISRNALGYWVCNICNKSCRPLTEIKKHIERHYSECDNQCTECLLSFENPDDLNFHKTSHVASSLVLGHVCKHCYKSFRQKHLLEKHVAAQHTDSNRSKPSLKHFRETCGKCVRVFYSSVEMENHDESCDEYELEAENESSEEESQESVLSEQSNDKRIPCYLCALLFESLSQLTFHFKKIHGGDRPFKCKVFGCGKSYKTPAGLKNHVYLSHLKFQKFECDICKKKCRDKTVLVHHMRSHTGERPFKCKTCGKSLRTEGTLVRHTRRHSAKYVCDVCGKVFSDKEYLKRHKFAHNPDIDFVCEHCGRGFNSFYNRGYHLKVKSCAKCGLEFLCHTFLRDHRLQGHLT